MNLSFKKSRLRPPLLHGGLRRGKARLIGIMVAVCLLVPLGYLISRMNIDWDRDGFTKAQVR